MRRTWMGELTAFLAVSLAAGAALYLYYNYENPDGAPSFAARPASSASISSIQTMEDFNNWFDVDERNWQFHLKSLDITKSYCEDSRFPYRTNILKGRIVPFPGNPNNRLVWVGLEFHERYGYRIWWEGRSLVFRLRKSDDGNWLLAGAAVFATSDVPPIGNFKRVRGFVYFSQLPTSEQIEKSGLTLGWDLVCSDAESLRGAILAKDMKIESADSLKPEHLRLFDFEK